MRIDGFFTILSEPLRLLKNRLPKPEARAEAAGSNGWKKCALWCVFPAMAIVLAGCCGPASTVCSPCGSPSAGTAKKAEVNGVFVYRLEQGMTANSKSVRLAGSVAGYDCGSPCDGPTPQWFGLRPAPATARPNNDLVLAGPAPVRAAPMSSPAPGNAGWVCPENTFSPIVCAPGPNLGECFTLPEELAATVNEVDVYAPNVQAPEKPADLPVAAAVEAVEAVEAAAVGTATAEKVDETASEQFVAAAGDVAAKPAAKAESPAEPAESGASRVDDMPPVFRAGADDRAAEEILSSAKMNADLDGLAPVELPPDLK